MTKIPPPTLFGLRREVYMIATLAIAYANLYFMQVMVEIYRLPALVVFIGQTSQV